jgi:GTP cyclohydrolase I
VPLSPPDPTRAVRDLLLGLGVDLDADPELRGTPERVARVWRDELLAGYQVDPALLLADALASDERGMVTVTRITYASVCPHHLLPSWGVAHVGYLPGGRIVGIGTVVRLVDAYARRLVLQETLGRQVAEALVTHLGAHAAGVALEASHACLSTCGERQAGARVVTHSFAGAWRDDAAGRFEFLRALPPGGGDR